jgi:protein TonB
VHAAALAALAMGALFAPSEVSPPRAPALVLNLAPPPPPPSRGAGEALERAILTAPASAVAALRLPARIPDPILSPAFEVPGTEYGFLDGSAEGFPGGVPGGVAGGVPGGIVGGVVGGTGDELPRFPPPDVGPRPIRMPQPSYTEEAIRNHVTGSVVLRVVIDERGGVRVLKVLRSVPELDQEAIRVVESSWRFQPATRNGRPVSALSDLVVQFRLY